MKPSAEKPRPVTIEEHAAFRRSIAMPPAVDPIDEAAAEAGPAQYRKESEVSRILSLLDSLETGKDGSE